MQGDIYRWTNAIFGWQKRYAEIEGEEFRFYKQKGGKLQSVVSLRDCKAEMIANEPLRLIVQLVEGPTLYLKCVSMADKVKWVNAISLSQQQQQPNDVAPIPGFSQLDSKINPKQDLAAVLHSHILDDTAKLNSYVTQIWTLQGLLEGALNDFSEDVAKLESPPSSLKTNAGNVKQYTGELKVPLLCLHL